MTSESILFQDEVTPDWKVPGVEVRRACSEDAAQVAALGLDAGADWVLVQEGGVVARAASSCITIVPTAIST